MRTTTRMRRAAALATTALMAAAVLTACGGDSDADDSSDDSSSESSEDGDPNDSNDSSAEDFVAQDAQDILDAAEEATTSASSLRVSGTTGAGADAASMDVVLTEDGCDGVIALGGAEVEVVGIDGENWFRASDEFWAQQGALPDEVLQQISGKWVVDEEGEFASFCSIDAFFSGDDEDNTDIEKGDVGEVDGQETVEITYTTGEGEDATAHVATEAPNYLLLVESANGGTFELSDFDEDVTITAPEDDEIVDLNDL